MVRRILLSILLFLATSHGAHAGEGLSADQMGDVVLYGQMSAPDGARYDVWIIPGYVGPLNQMAAGWSDAGKDLAEYTGGKLYGEIYDTGKAMLKFAGKTSVAEFVLEGSVDAWSTALSAASKRSDQRVFGWWFAYPWAVIEATGESALRIAIGIPGGVIVAGLGTTVVPAAQLVWPVGKSVYHGVIKGTALPIVAMTWNTVISPPMALAGDQPTPARADGFWMKRLSRNEMARQDPDLTRVEGELRQWRHELLNAPEVLAVRRESQLLDKDYEQKRKLLREEQNRQHQQLEEKRITIILQKAREGSTYPDTGRPELADILQKYGKQHVIGVLVGEGINPQQAEALLTTIAASQQVDAAPELTGESAARDKTDPLIRSLELIAK